MPSTMHRTAKVGRCGTTASSTPPITRNAFISIAADLLSTEDAKVRLSACLRRLRLIGRCLMTQFMRVLPCFVLLCAGCTSAPQPQMAAGDAEQKEQIRHVLIDIIDACEKKDFARLDNDHLYGPKFTKYDTGSPARWDAAAAREGERKGLAAANDLHMQAKDLDIEVFGNTGISTFSLVYQFKVGTDNIERSARATLVFVKEHGAWKIAHEHLSTVTRG